MPNSTQKFPVFEAFRFTPIKKGEKRPLLAAWQLKPFKWTELVSPSGEIAYPGAGAIGLLLGEVSGGIIGLDCDGIDSAAFLESLGLPPTLTVSSGAAGRFLKLFRIPEEQWSEIPQKKVVKRGADHFELRWNNHQSLVFGLHPSGREYRVLETVNSFAEIPFLPPSLLAFLKEEEGDRPQGEMPSPAVAPTSAVDPQTALYRCLAIAHRALVDYGASEGSRNDDAAALARDLIGTARWLEGKNIYPDPRALFDQFCSRCSPPLGSDNPKEPETVWRSAERDNPTPCLSEDKLENCLQAYFRECGAAPKRETKKVRLLKELRAAEANRAEADAALAAGSEEPPRQDKRLKTPGEECGFVNDPLSGKLYWVKAQGEFVERVEVGNALECAGYCQTPTGDGAAVVLKFLTVHREERTCLISRSALAGDGNEVLAALLARDYWYSRPSKQKLLSYLQGLSGGDRFLLVANTGWVEGERDRSFVLPHTTVGDQKIRWQSFEPPQNHPYSPKGELSEWKDSVAKFAQGNSRLVFALSCAFAGALLAPLDLGGGGFNLWGATSKGKTTAIEVASSVTGHPDKILRSWRATENGLEAIASEHNDLTLFLDELKEAHPKVVDAASYLLANGVGKQRARRTGDRAPVKTWRCLFLSTGEMPFLEYLRAQGLVAKGGQEIRLLDIEACVGQHGLFENLHGFPSGAALSNHLKTAARQCYGVALIPFLEKLRSLPVCELRQDYRHLLEALAVEGQADTAVFRAIQRFAVVALAGELATQWGILPLASGEALHSAQVLLSGWLENRGGVGNHDLKQALQKIEAVLRENFHCGFAVVGSEGQIENEPRARLLGYRKGEEILVLPSVFEELAAGCDRKTLIAELIKRGWLRSAGGKPCPTRWIGGRNQRFYCFTQFWCEGEKQE